MIFYIGNFLIFTVAFLIGVGLVVEFRIRRRLSRQGARPNRRRLTLIVGSLVLAYECFLGALTIRRATWLQVVLLLIAVAVVAVLWTWGERRRRQLPRSSLFDRRH